MSKWLMTHKACETNVITTNGCCWGNGNSFEEMAITIKLRAQQMREHKKRKKEKKETVFHFFSASKEASMTSSKAMSRNISVHCLVIPVIKLA